MSVDKKDSLQEIFPDIINDGILVEQGIVTKRDYLREWEYYFKTIERLLIKFGMENTQDFVVGKKIKDGTNEVIYFYPYPGWGFTSFTFEMGCRTYRLEEILDELHPPEQIRNNLISLLKRLFKTNRKKIDEIRSELRFVNKLIRD